MEEIDEVRGYLYDNYHYFHLNDSLGNEMNFHRHEFNKVVVFISGKVDYTVEGITYPLRAMDVLFVGEHQIHRAVVDTSVPYERIILYISPDYLRTCSTGKSNLEECFTLARERGCCLARPTGAQQVQLMRTLQELEDAVHSDNFGADILADSCFSTAMVVLNRLMISDEITCLGAFGEYDPRINDTINYINKNLTEELSVDELAERSFISKYHFMRRFKEFTGYTVHGYITEKRLVNAAALIREGVPVAQAAEKSGFGDYSAFLRAFKKTFGTTPGKY